MRHAFTVFGFLLIALIVGMAIFLYGPTRLSGVQTTSTTVVPQTDVSFIPLVSGTQSTISKRANYVIRSDGELRELWKMLDAGGMPPVIDFSKNIVVAVFVGQESTGGYSISVSRVADSASARTVSITLTKPGGSCILPQVLTAPYQIVELASTSLPLSHINIVTTTSCIQ